MTIGDKVAHYFWGLFAAAWNAGIAALYTGLTQGAGAGISEVAGKVLSIDGLHQVAIATLPSFRELVLIFAGAAVFESIRWLRDHPLPTDPALPHGAPIAQPVSAGSVGAPTVPAAPAEPINTGKP